MASLPKAWVYGHSLHGIAGSNSTGGINVSFLLVLCVVMQRSLRGADHSSRGVLPDVISLNVIVKPR